MTEVLDLFAGPGGWDVAASQLGLDVLGVELDPDACATRKLAGLTTLQSDVSALEPADFAPCHLMIASPPCQAFSKAGKGKGREAISSYHQVIEQMALGHAPDYQWLDTQCDDPRGHLVLEPLRWALALRPELIACEQVEPVLPLWQSICLALRCYGYQTWCGILFSECYGTPQTRRRAILMASLHHQPQPPRPTHQRFVSSRRKPKQEELLFELPKERIVLPEDRPLKPWVSMAQALGWGMTNRPTHTVTAGGTGSGGGVEVFAGGDVRDVVARERDEGRWLSSDQVGFGRREDHRTEDPSVEVNGTAYRSRDFRTGDEPAPTVTEKARSMVRLVANAQENACTRSIDEPAPAITGGHDFEERVWTHMNTGRDWKKGGSREDAQKISVDEPSPAISAVPLQSTWIDERPATTIAGDPRVHPPGHKEDGDDPPDTYEQRRGANAIRVTESEAGVLQGFSPDYPWQGSKTARYRQIGDAVPPPLALAVLRALTTPAPPGD